MKLLLEADQEVASWVGERVDHGSDRDFENCRAVGVVNDTGEMIAGYVYHNWHPEHGVMEISGAATDPRWLTKPVLQNLLGWPFQQGCQLIVMRVAPSNVRLLRQLRAVGFDLYNIPRLRGRNKAEVVCTLADDVWLTGKFAK